MAYGFPVTYQQFYPQYPTVSNMNQQQGNGIVWVQGVEAAKAYAVAPNSTIPLWDSESQTIYLKSTDASGMPSMRILDYSIRSEPPRTAQNALSGNGVGTPTKDDIQALQSQIDSLKRQIEQMGGVHESSLQPDATGTAKQRSNAEIATV